MPDQAPYPDSDWMEGNLSAADQQMKLTSAEKSLYRHHLANLNKGGVKNADGSTSTVLAKTVGFGDKTYVLPTVWDNKIVDLDTAIKNARAKGLDSFPSYGSPEEAKARYMQMHDFMEGDIR